MHNAHTVAMTIDGWTSLSAHYIDEEWALQSHVLQTRKLTEAHTGKNLAALLQEVFCEWKLQDKKTALVTDNASNMLLAAALAKEGLHVRCVVHLLNLASQTALKVEKVLKLLVKVRKVSVLYNDKVYFIHSLTYSFIHPFRWLHFFT